MAPAIPMQEVDLIGDIQSELPDDDSEQVIKAKGCQPRFYIKETVDINGKVCKTQEWVEITIPGQRGSVVTQVVTDAHKIDFPAHYAAFRAGKSGIIGTPIETAPFLTTPQLNELRYYNVLTIEALAGLVEFGLARIANGRQLQMQARAHLKQAVAIKQAAGADRENAELRSLVTQQAEQMKALMARLDAIESPKPETAAVEPVKRGPGRPPSHPPAG